MKSLTYMLTIAMFILVYSPTLAQLTRTIQSPYWTKSHEKSIAKSEQLKDLAQIALLSRSYSVAERLFKQSLLSWPGNFDAIVGLSDTLEKENKVAEACTYYKQVVSPAATIASSLSSDPILRLHYAILLSKNHEWDKSVSLYEDAISHIPIGGGDQLPYQKFSFEKGNIDSAKLEAIAHLQIGLRDPRHKSLSKEEKLEHFKEAARLVPNLAIVQFYYGYGLEHVGKNAEAKAAYQKAVRLSEPNSYLNSQAKEFEKTAGQKGWSNPPNRIGFVPAKKQ